MNVRQQQILATTVALILAFGISLTASKLWKFFHLDSSGMSNSSINIIHQDRSGVIWIGTWDGLNRYDGNKYTLYNSILNDSTTLTHPVIRDIQEEELLPSMDSHRWRHQPLQQVFGTCSALLFKQSEEYYFCRTHLPLRH